MSNPSLFTKFAPESIALSLNNDPQLYLIKVIQFTNSGIAQEYLLADLLPNSFGPEDL